MPQFVARLIRRQQLIYVTLAAVWALILAWQVVEHQRVQRDARKALITRSEDITTTLELVIRSQRRFGSFVSQERLESALTALVKFGELSSIALLNASNEVVASAGPPLELGHRERLRPGEQWGDRFVTVMSLVDFGFIAEGTETNRPTIVMPRRDPSAPPREEDRDRQRPTPPRPTNGEAGPQNLFAGPDRGSTNRFERDGRGGRPPFRMDEKEYKALLESRGLHGLVIGMSTDTMRRVTVQDIWMRGIIGIFASVAVVGLGLAWRNLAKSSELQVRLVRASELNTHLKGMNLAAAGLAHETRNPLNIIRGLAQMISKENDATTEVRRKSREIIDETDRVTAQLNEFINYSRPREVRRAAVPLTTVVNEVIRALSYDLEEKCIHIQKPEDLPVIEADEQLLRQTLFNLLLNAVQAVERGGDIEVTAWKNNGHDVTLEIRDNGPGVTPENRTEIFKPYFTTHQKGTGLGLAVVQQIVLAHGWDIECLPNEPRGAIFRVSHIKPVAKT
jgi:signal transduction histidine kinase